MDLWWADGRRVESASGWEKMRVYKFRRFSTDGVRALKLVGEVEGIQ